MLHNQNTQYYLINIITEKLAPEMTKLLDLTIGNIGDWGSIKYYYYKDAISKVQTKKLYKTNDLDSPPLSKLKEWERETERISIV